MKIKTLTFSSSVLLYAGTVAAHSGHLEHSSNPDLLPLIGVFAGVIIMAAGLFFSLKKYSELSEEETDVEI
jgi:hypothetical protein